MAAVPATIGCFRSLRAKRLSSSSTNYNLRAVRMSLNSGGDIHLIELLCRAGRHLLYRLGAARRGPTEALSGSPGSTDFPTHPRVNTGAKISESPRSRSKSRRQVRQQRRFNFRDSIGCFETSRLVVPQPCSSPSSKSGQAAKQPSSAWIAPGSHAGFWASHHSRAAKLMASKTEIFLVYLQHTG